MISDSRSYDKGAEDILLGVTKGKRDGLVDDRSDPLVYAFLLFLSLKHVEVKRIDEAALKETGDSVEYLAKSQNVLADYFSLEADWDKCDIDDFIGFLEEDNKPVIVERGLFKYWILNPENGERKRYDSKKVHLSEKALSIIPIADANIKSGMKLTLKVLGEQRTDMVFFALLTFAVALLSFLVPLGIKKIISMFMIYDAINNLLAMGISLVLTVLAVFLINIVVNRSKIRVQAKSRHKIVATILSKIMAINAGDENSIQEELIATFLPYINSLDNSIDSILNIAIYSVQIIVIFCATSGTNAIHSRMLGPMIIIAVGIYAISIVFSYRATIAKRNTGAILKMAKKEMMDNIETIKNYNIADRIFYRFAVAYDSDTDNSVLLNSIGQWNGLLMTMFSELAMFLLFIGEAGAKSGKLSEVYSVASSISIIVGYLGNLFSSIGTLINSIPYQKLADRVLNFENEGELSQGYTGEVTGAIELNNVSYSYDDGTNMVINNLSLKITPGEYVGIVGASGCGKSTLIKLLMGFCRPTSGVISYDGIDINQYDLQNLRRQFGVVMQSAEVVSGSIKSNIGMTQNPDMEKVERAAKVAEIYDDIMAMPMNFNTHISSESEVVSGGQRQRIVLARALINNPKILILDEATSAIDNVLQTKIKKNLDKMNITRIVVAHRLSTIENCDRILVIDKGNIVESGTYAELMDKKGLFYSMARRNLA